MWGGFPVAWLTYFINVYLVRNSIDISSYSAELSILLIIKSLESVISVMSRPKVFVFSRAFWTRIL